MSILTVRVHDNTLAALNLTPEQMADELRLAAAVKLFEIGRLSAGAAAQLADMPVPLFLSRLGEYGVSALSLSDEELAEDVRLA
jgi:predicted HTH domain antitoxin